MDNMRSNEIPNKLKIALGHLENNAEDAEDAVKQTVNLWNV